MMSALGVAELLSVAVVLCLSQKVASYCNCTENSNGGGYTLISDGSVGISGCTTDFKRELGFAFVVVVCVSLFLGVVLGVACSVAAYKFMKWMEGKTLFFSPWPRIQSARGLEESALQNPTYELGANDIGTSAKRYIKNTGQALPRQNTNKTQEVYEAIEEPINQAEALEPSEQFTPLPYAIHDFAEGSGIGLVEDQSTSSNVTIKGPAIASKVNISRPKKGKGKNADMRRSMSESGRLEKPAEKKSPKPIALKPPIAQKAANLKKPPLKSHRTQSTSAAPPQGTYSELDQKTSYATLEPHIGGDEVTLPDTSSKESYCHLNH